jgi:midasin
LDILVNCPLQPVRDPKRLDFLIKSLSSLLDYYETLFTSALDADIQSNKKQIEKELREFIDIYKWQDDNYWSLKLSIQKSNRTLLRTIRKFKSYLKTPVDFERLVKASTTDGGAIIRFESSSNKKTLLNYFKLSESTMTVFGGDSEIVCEKYLKKMLKLARKVLTVKFAKNRLNRSISVLSTRIHERYADLEKETKLLNSRYASTGKDKELGKKLKKEFKYLNQEKLKFLSDLIKELSAIGISYRRG